MTHAAPAAAATAIGLGPTEIVRWTEFEAGSTTELRQGRFRAYAEAVEAQLGNDRIGGLRGALTKLREAIEAQLNSA